MSFLDSFYLGFGPQLINLKCKPKQWDNFHRDHHVCERFMFCVKFWDCGTSNKLAFQEINTPSKHPSNMVMCHAFFVGFFGQAYLWWRLAFRWFSCPGGLWSSPSQTCHFQYFKVYCTRLNQECRGMDSYFPTHSCDPGMKAPAIASSVRRRFSISQPHRWLHSSALHHHWSWAKCMANMERKWGTHIFASFCR